MLQIATGLSIYVGLLTVRTGGPLNLMLAVRTLLMLDGHVHLGHNRFVSILVSFVASFLSV